MPRRVLAVAVAVFVVAPVWAQDRLIRIESAQAPQAAIDKLEALATARGLKIFARIDHAAGAQSIGESLRPTQVLIFGNPKGGTPVLQCAQTLGIALPLHVLGWEDAEGKHWLGYERLTVRGMGRSSADCEPRVKRLMDTLESLVNAAAKP